MTCLTGLVFTNEVTIKLRNFSTAQRELVKELLAAKQLGICKTTTYGGPKLSFKNLDSILKNGKNSIKIDIILTREESKEML